MIYRSKNNRTPEFTLEHWTEADYKRLIGCLYEVSDEGCKKFSERLIPGCESIIGVRVPVLRELAKEIARGNAEEYVSLKKGCLHEEILLEGFVIGNMKLDYAGLSEYIRYFADKVNNWAVSDTTSSSMKRIRKYRKEFISDIERLICSENPWHIRYGILFLMQYYCDDEYIDYTLKTLAKATNDEYYVKMAQAWCLSVAMVKHREKTLAAIEKGEFDSEVMNMFVRKVRDSKRISKEDKDFVLKFK